MDVNQQKELLFFLKALAEESRLALLHALTENERSVGDLARQVDLGEPTVSHHLSRLREVGLVTLRMEGTQRFYRVNKNGVARFKTLAQEIDQPAAAPEPTAAVDHSWIAALGWDEADQKILREYIQAGKMVRWPSKQKAYLVILRWLATLFEPIRLYSEKEINEVLKAVYADDYVTLRRDLVDTGYLRRERGGGNYWLAPEEDGPQQA